MTVPLVLLHGFAGSPAGFAHLIRALPGGTPFVAPALVGHDDAARVSVAGFEGEVDRLAALLEARRTGADPRFHLCGYSLGGRLGLGLLVRHPHLFATATLIGAQPGLEGEDDRRERRRADEHLCQILEQLGIETFVTKWESLPLFASQQRLPAAALAAQRSARLARDPRELARSLRLTGLGAMPPYWTELASVRVPTTLVVGALDAKFSDIAARMAERTPTARVATVPGAGHNVVLEDPPALAAILQAMIDRVP